jgi:hypothetical protein
MALPWAACLLLAAFTTPAMMPTMGVATQAASCGGDQAYRDARQGHYQSLGTVHLLHDCSPHHQ